MFHYLIEHIDDMHNFKVCTNFILQIFLCKRMLVYGIFFIRNDNILINKNSYKIRTRGPHKTKLDPNKKDKHNSIPQFIYKSVTENDLNSAILDSNMNPEFNIVTTLLYRIFLIFKDHHIPPHPHIPAQTENHQVPKYYAPPPQVLSEICLK